jgi:hypothetical protein
MELPEKERTFYETVSGRPDKNGNKSPKKQKPRFDIDIDPLDLPIMTKPEDIVNKVIHTVISIFEQISLTDFLIYTSSNEKKYSYHIVINHWYHNDSKEADKFYKKVSSLLPADIKMFVDGAVYKTTQQFRLLFNTKYGADRYKKIITEWNYYGKVIKREKKDDYKEFMYSLLAHVDGCCHLEQPDEFSRENPPGKPKKLFDNTLTPERLLELVPDGYIIDGKEERDYGMRLQRTHPSLCLICNRWHGKDTRGNTDSIGDNARMFIKDGGIYFACFRGKPGEKYLLETLELPVTPTELDKILGTIKAIEQVPFQDNVKGRKDQSCMTRQFTAKDLMELFMEERNKLGLGY